MPQNECTTSINKDIITSKNPIKYYNDWVFISLLFSYLHGAFLSKNILYIINCKIYITVDFVGLVDFVDSVDLN